MKKLGLFVAFLSLISCSQNQGSSDVVELFDSQTLSIEQVESDNAILSIVENNGKKAINVKNGDTYEAVVVINSAEGQPWDLSNTYQVKAEVTNTGKNRNQVAMYVGLDPDPLMRWYCSNYVDLDPGETRTVTVDLTWLDWVHDKPIEFKGMRGIPGAEKTDRSLVQQVSLNLEKPASPQEFTVNRVYAVGTTEVRSSEGFFPFVDEFGQYKHDEWKDKVHNFDELLALVERDRKDLEEHPQAPDVNEYGGWTAGPKLKATGYFRTEKIDGKWWLVDPEGCIFWSTGVNGVFYSGGTTTTITGREGYYEELPANSGGAAQFYNEGRGATSFNQYGYNLYRIYGEDFADIYHDLTHQRFDSWGLNTIKGGVEGLLSKKRTPYVGMLGVRGTVKIEGSSGYQGKFHDVFEPNFERLVKESLESNQDISGAGDPWCLGFFVDNELSWGGAGSLSVATLASPADQPAKITFVNDLKAKYKSITALNSVWGSDYKSWNDILQRTDTPDETKAQEDLYAFYEKLSNKYFKTIHDELARLAPHQLYLGCRLAWVQNDITMTAASKYCDVMSFNKYEYNIEYLSLPEGVDSPVIIGEFHYGALDRGMFHRGCLQGALTQEDRGQMYQDFVRSALRNEFIVGAHWFRYMDEALTGQFGGENYNIGLVNCVDVAYPELVTKVRETCYDKYNYRYNR